MDFKIRESATPLLDGFVDENGRQYGRTAGGNVRFGDLTRNLWNEQDQYTACFLDGKTRGADNLGEGLKIEGESRDEFSLAVAPEDAEELMNRIAAYRGLSVGREYDTEARRVVPISQERREEFAAYLKERGLPLPYQYYLGE